MNHDGGKIDWWNIGKWVCIIGGALLTMLGTVIIDGHIKDRKFEEEVRKQVSDKLNGIGS